MEIVIIVGDLDIWLEIVGIDREQNWGEKTEI